MSKPNYSGTFNMDSQENMDEYLAALDIHFALRKIVCLLRPSKQISHDPVTGDMKIRTLTTFRNFDMNFTIGQEFTEDLGPVDGRTCQTTVDWDGDKLVCIQRGEKEGRGWTHWLEDNKLHLVQWLNSHYNTIRQLMGAELEKQGQHEKEWMPKNTKSHRNAESPAAMAVSSTRLTAAALLSTLPHLV